MLNKNQNDEKSKTSVETYALLLQKAETNYRT